MVRKGAAYPGIGDWVALALAGALSFFLLLSNPAARIRAAKALHTTVLSPFRLVLWYGSAPPDVNEELIRLRQRLAGRYLDDAVCRDALRENARLRSLLGIDRREENVLVPTQVIGRAIDRFGEVLTVGRGQENGVYEGQPVMGIEGLVGVVSAVEDRQSWVRTIRHGALPVSGRLQDTRYVGTLRWDPTRRLFRLEGIPMQSPVPEGADVVTSGHGMIFPKGIPIGRVVKVADDSTALVKDILIRPFIDFDRVEEVLLLGNPASPEEG